MPLCRYKARSRNSTTFLYSVIGSGKIKRSIIMLDNSKSPGLASHYFPCRSNSSISQPLDLRVIRHVSYGLCQLLVHRCLVHLCTLCILIGCIYFSIFHWWVLIPVKVLLVVSILCQTIYSCLVQFYQSSMGLYIMYFGFRLVLVPCARDLFDVHLILWLVFLCGSMILVVMWF